MKTSLFGQFHPVPTTPDEDIPVERIGKGAFSTVYREKDGQRVFVFSSYDTYDKGINAEAHLDDNPHIPHVEKFGSTRDQAVYVMPLYKSPLRKADSPEGWRDFTVLKKCHDKAQRDRFAKNRTSIYDLGYPVNMSTVDCVKENGVKPAVVEALESLVSTASNYGSTYAFEFAPRNLASDANGNLVLLDVMFDLEAMERARSAKRRG